MLAKVGAELQLTDPFAPRPKWQTWTAFSVLVAAFVCAAIFASDSDRFHGYAALCSLMLASALLFASWIDLDRFILPDVITLPLIAIGVGVTFYLDGNIWLSIGGAIIGYTVIAGIAWIWRSRFGRDGLGLGDAKLLAGGGAWVGALHLPIVLLIASGIGLLFALSLSLRKSVIGTTMIPFGPLLSFGIWAAWCLPLVGH